MGIKESPWLVGAVFVGVIILVIMFAVLTQSGPREWWLAMQSIAASIVLVLLSQLSIVLR